MHSAGLGLTCSCSKDFFDSDHEFEVLKTVEKTKALFSKDIPSWKEI